MILTNGGRYYTFRTKFETPFNFTIKDGKLVNGGLANLISMVSKGSAEQNITLDNLDISLIGTGTADTTLITRYNSDSTTNTGKLNMTLKNCDIDTTASTASIRIFQAGRYDGMFNVNYTVIGGTVKTASYHSNMFYAENGSTLTFLPGADGKNTLISLPTGSTLSQITYYDGDGKNIYMVEQSTDGTYDVYIPESLVTPYGAIPWSKSSRVDYPFHAFRDNGNGTYTYITSSANYFANGGMESSLRSEASSVVLMRRDFCTTNYQGNISNNPNSILIDLGGYTLSMTHSFGAIQLIAKHNTTTNLTIKNGTVLLQKRNFITFYSAASVPAGEGKVFNVTLENLTFKYDEGATVTSPYKFTSTELAYEVNLNISDCTFDYSENCPSGATAIIATAPKLVTFNPKVIGCRFIANDLDSVKIADDLSALTFYRNSRNEYITIQLPIDAESPKFSPNTDLGNMNFVKLRGDGEYAVYYLRDISKLVSPKVSLTLYSDFVYNIYVPVKDSVVGITLDGKTYNLTDLTIVEVEGVKYYHITKRIAVSYACDEYVLSIEMQLFEGSTHTLSWKVGIISYVQRLIDGNHTVTTKALAKDILSYIRATYIYAQIDENAVKMIDAIIGENYDASSTPNTSINAAISVNGLSSATLELGESPAFRFYIDGSYDPSLYKFTVNGNSVNTEILTDSDSRTYIRVSMYAYAMTYTVCYTVEGTDIVGEYNLKAYYEFAKTTNNPDLVSLVERLWKYSESALAYKAEATA